MKKFIATLLIVTILTPSLAFAEETSRTPVIVGDPGLLAPLPKGSPAPFSGVLISPRGGSVIVADYDVFGEKMRIEVDAAVAKAHAEMEFKVKENAAQCEADKTILTAKVTSRDDKLAVLESDLKRTEEELKKTRESMPDRSTWFGIGFGTGLLITIATVYAASQLSK